MTNRLLVTTSKKFILWDGKPHIIQENQGLYYGITWGYEKVYVVSRGASGSPVQMFDKQLAPVGYVPFRWLGEDPHQAFWWKNRLYIANRDKFCVSFWDFHAEVEGMVHSTLTDQHINSVWCDGELFYVIEHRHDRTPKFVHIYTDSWRKVNVLSIHTGPQDELTGHGIHNVYTEYTKLVTLAPDSLYVIDRPGKGRVRKIPFDMPSERIYLRGLARTAKHYYVGVSNYATRSFRGEGDSWICVLDSCFELQDVITLPDTGQILEVRSVDDIDFAHNRLECPIKKGGTEV